MMRWRGTARAVARRSGSPAWSSSTTPSAEGHDPRRDQRTIGILGGTFDPVHNGHLEAARELRDLADLDQVWLMPNAQPPHRVQPLAGPEDRMRMVESAVDGEAGLLPSRLEVNRGGISYTID